MKQNGWITFTAQNILRVMRGEKTQTRRPIKTQPLGNVTSTTLWKDGLWRIEHDPVKAHDLPAGNYTGVRVKCPYGRPGDILGVKEGYQIMGTVKTFNVWGAYLADGFAFDVTLTGDEWLKWKARKFPYRATPGRFMYKSLCRTRLEVLDVRVERVQDISEADARAEGITRTNVVLSANCNSGIHTEITGDRFFTLSDPDDFEGWEYAEDAFADLWDSIYAKKGLGFDVNPWVFVTTFKVLKGESNVDKSAT